MFNLRSICSPAFWAYTFVTFSKQILCLCHIKTNCWHRCNSLLCCWRTVYTKVLQETLSILPVRHGDFIMFTETNILLCIGFKMKNSLWLAHVSIYHWKLNTIRYGTFVSFVFYCLFFCTSRKKRTLKSKQKKRDFFLNEGKHKSPAVFVAHIYS